MEKKYILDTPVSGNIGTLKCLITIKWRNGVLITDEPVELGGKDKGPDPYTLLMASLASCTLATLRMYIDRKEWVVPEITVEVNFYQLQKGNGLVTNITRSICFGTPLDAEKQERLLKIAQACPVSKILKNEVVIEDEVY